MEDQASWKGHGFTLLVFVGIVILCSIFFVLGMLVGRGQGQHTAQTAVVTAAAKAATAEARTQTQTQNDRSELSSTPGIEAARVPQLIAVPPTEPVKEKPPVTVAQTKAAPAAAPVPEKMLYLQVDALEKSSAARMEVDELRKKGFSAIILEPGGTNKLYRVHVGPFSNTAEADIAKRKLESMGYKPIKK